MPRYFFRLHDGVTYVDREGEEHPDDEAARRAAQNTASQFFVEILGMRNPGELIVVNESGKEIARLPMRWQKPAQMPTRS
jgi:hypothetical protein